MKRTLASEFKGQCLRVPEEVRATREPVMISVLVNPAELTSIAGDIYSRYVSAPGRMPVVNGKRGRSRKSLGKGKGLMRFG